MIHPLGEEILKCIIVFNESRRIEATAILHSAMIHFFISQCAFSTRIPSTHPPSRGVGFQPAHQHLPLESRSDPEGITHLSTGSSVSDTLCHQYPKIPESRRDSTTWDLSLGARADLLNPFRIRHEWGEPITGCHLRFNPVLRYSIPLGFQNSIPATCNHQSPITNHQSPINNQQSTINNLQSAVCCLLLATCYSNKLQTTSKCGFQDHGSRGSFTGCFTLIL